MPESKPKREVTQGMTFRLKESYVEKLKEFSKNDRTNTSVLVNQIICDYIEWDYFAVKAGWLVFPKYGLKMLIDGADEKTLLNIAKQMAEYKKDIILLMTGDNTLDGFITVVRNRIKKSGFQLREFESEGLITLVIQHDMGPKWSLLNKTMYEQVLNNLGHKATIDSSDNTLVIKIHL